jgi:hypothetical protein
MMRNKVLVLSCVLALVFFLGAVSLAGAAEKEPVVGQSVGIAKFKAPITEDGAKYLGLAKAGPFTLTDVKAPYLLVEQFNTSCPHCMAQAPVMNALFAKVEADPQLKGKLKFVGAGQGHENGFSMHDSPFRDRISPKRTAGLYHSVKGIWRQSGGNGSGCPVAGSLTRLWRGYFTTALIFASTSSAFSKAPIWTKRTLPVLSMMVVTGYGVKFKALP